VAPVVDPSVLDSGGPERGCPMAGSELAQLDVAASWSWEEKRRIQTWRERNPDQVAAYNASRRVQPAKLQCVECGEAFEGRPNRLVCSRRCKDRRYARLHPEQVREKNRRHQANRRARSGVFHSTRRPSATSTGSTTRVGGGTGEKAHQVAALCAAIPRPTASLPRATRRKSPSGLHLSREASHPTRHSRIGDSTDSG
jgi:hypothetical protein